MTSGQYLCILCLIALAVVCAALGFGIHYDRVMSEMAEHCRAVDGGVPVLTIGGDFACVIGVR